VRQTEELVRQLRGKRKRAAPSRDPSPELAALEAKLREALGTRVKVRHGRKGGSIIIHYYSDEELDALLERLTGSAD
jgi:ParB family chromosome partitioning protein